MLSTFGSFHAAILFSFKSTTVTWISGHFCAITAIVGPPTYPAPMQQIFVIFIYGSAIIQFANIIFYDGLFEVFPIPFDRLFQSIAERILGRITKQSPGFVNARQ